LDEAANLYGNFPSYPGFDKEFNFIGNFNPDTSDITLVIFWEEWCPYCDRVMSKIEKLHRQYNNYGINMVGVTNMWRPSTRDDSEKFLKEHDISFPIIKESGKAFDHFGLEGVPSIRLIYKGKVVWDNPSPSVEPISRLMLEGIVKALKS